MKNLFCLPGLIAALCLASPALGLANDGHDNHGGHGGHDYHGGHGNWNGYHGDWHGHSYYGYHGHYYGGGGYYPFYSYYPYYSAPYYGAYYGAPSVGLSISTGPTYRGAQASGDDLAIDVQRALQHDGYYHGTIDGDIGAGTRAAIRQYQYDRHLEVTGRIDRSLLRSLGLD